MGHGAVGDYLLVYAGHLCNLLEVYVGSEVETTNFVENAWPLLDQLVILDSLSANNKETS